MSRKPGPWRSLLGPLKVIISSGNAYKDNCVPGFTVPSLSRKGARDMPQQQNTKIPIVFEVGSTLSTQNWSPASAGRVVTSLVWAC